MTAHRLPTRRLGTTDLEITRLGFGSWAVAGSGHAVSTAVNDVRRNNGHTCSIRCLCRDLALTQVW